MRTIVDDLHVRLSAAGLRVLLPEQRGEPHQAAPLDAQGRPMVGGGERGLGVYLAQHSQGVVQVEEPVPIGGDGLTGTFWTAVAAIAPDAATAHDLGQQVRRLLIGHPFAPEHYREVTPAQPQQLAPGAWMVRATFSATTLDGLLAGG